MLHVILTHKIMGSPSRDQDNVGGGHIFSKVLKCDSGAAEPIGQLLRMLRVSRCHPHMSNTVGNEMLRRQLGHFPCPYQQHRFLAEIREDFFG